MNTNVSSLLFEGLNTFTNYCVTVEPLTELGSTWEEDCYDFVTEDDGERICISLVKAFSCSHVQVADNPRRMITGLKETKLNILKNLQHDE